MDSKEGRQERLPERRERKKEIEREITARGGFLGNVNVSYSHKSYYACSNGKKAAAFLSRERTDVE